MSTSEPAGTLLGLWQRSESLLRGKSFCQIIQFSGAGKLGENNDTSRELRELLSAVPLERLAAFANECMEHPFHDSGLALQDIANEVGVRLGFKVEFGRYRGTKNAIGFDGLWGAKDDHFLLVEVKTTDAYRINLDTIAAYREQLIATARLTDHSSILIVVGRQDTGDLEAQIRGSRHAWDVRLISVDAIFRLAAVKEQMSDWATSTRINQVLRPMEYTRLDQIVGLLFDTSKDIESGDQEEPGISPSDEEPKTRTNLEPARAAAFERVAKKLSKPLVRKGRALRTSSDGATNVVCLASQRYDGPGGSRNYWYGFTPAQRDFVQEAAEGWIAFACQDSGRVFLIERDEFLHWLPTMLTTPPDASDDAEVRHWHIYFNDYGDRVELMPRASEGPKHDIVDRLLAD